jgi:hypothetical protein
MSAPVPTRRWLCFRLRTLFVAVAVTAVCIYLGQQLYWIRERENLILEWRTLGGHAYVGPAPWTIRVLGAPGIAKFEYGFVDGVSTRPSLILPNDDSRQRVARLFPESQVEMVYRW